MATLNEKINSCHGKFISMKFIGANYKFKMSFVYRSFYSTIRIFIRPCSYCVNSFTVCIFLFVFMFRGTAFQNYILKNSNHNKMLLLNILKGNVQEYCSFLADCSTFIDTNYIFKV